MSRILPSRSMGQRRPLQERSVQHVPSDPSELLPVLGETGGHRLGSPESLRVVAVLLEVAESWALPQLQLFCRRGIDLGSLASRHPGLRLHGQNSQLSLDFFFFKQKTAYEMAPTTVQVTVTGIATPPPPATPATLLGTCPAAAPACSQP